MCLEFQTYGESLCILDNMKDRKMEMIKVDQDAQTTEILSELLLHECTQSLVP